MVAARRVGIPVVEKDFSLTTVYSADEAFVTGTFAGLSCVGSVDGRAIGDGKAGTVLLKLRDEYLKMKEEEAGRGRIVEEFSEKEVLLHLPELVSSL